MIPRITMSRENCMLHDNTSCGGILYGSLLQSLYFQIVPVRTNSDIQTLRGLYRNRYMYQVTHA